MWKYLVAALAIVCAAPSFAKTVSGVELSDTISANEQQLTLNGAGVRSKFFIDLYVGSLYLSQANSDANAIINSDEISAIRLNITSGLITSDKLIEAIVEGFDLSTNGDTAAIQSRIDNFIAVFNEEIVKGDQYTFVFTPGTGVVGYKNGEQKVSIDGDDFRTALMGIWLGAKPAQKKLKQRMLGN
ncbi:chalcone isomerase family protein [Paraferrimonas haliotis]|uniref:Chalcone isomerase n=1 Tax=Paraferrimonas haliotis TaxID=2013866 RepID=A0AA37TQM8_9GAMM|nr:chalcone isomerase family protein [Paraferrimonas haliotis]GLS83625.1 chalcone isomerase [Paraferrimonas haliotis]